MKKILIIILILTNSNLIYSQTVSELIESGIELYSKQNYLDAREKFQEAIRADPDNYEGYLYLAEYYKNQVGHYKLSKKYLTQANEKFTKKNGPAPYLDFDTKSIHAKLLLTESSLFLYLDKYKQAIDTLDTYKNLNYYSEYYISSRAWIEMKMGEIDKSIQTAQDGLFYSMNPSHILNVLGISLSINKQRKEALEIFEKAIEYEIALKEYGSPSTPLNNSGEVLREIFKEDKALYNFKKSASYPDACENILPYFNITVVNLDSLNLFQSKKALVDFNKCFSQYTLKNKEEHQVNIDLGFSRIAFHLGNIPEAIKKINSANEKQQWFGSIGTSPDDMSVAINTSLLNILKAYSHHLKFNNFTLKEKVLNNYQRLKNYLRFKKTIKNTRVTLAKLKNFEDIYIRNSDSMIEYSQLGIIFSDILPKVTKERINTEINNDIRQEAQLYYKAFLAESMINSFLNKKEGLTLAKTLIKNKRSKYDNAIIDRLKLLILSNTKTKNQEYYTLLFSILEKTPAKVLNYGIRIPVNIEDKNKKYIKNSFFEACKIKDCLSNLTIIDNKVELNSKLIGFKSIDISDKTKTKVFEEFFKFLINKGINE